jgi:hypothetical protein
MTRRAAWSRIKACWYKRVFLSTIFTVYKSVPATWSIIEHRALIGFDGEIGHSSRLNDVFRPGAIEEILNDGGIIRVVYPTRSLQETEWRFSRANQIMGVSWWKMNCHTTTDFIVGRIPHVWIN